MDRVLKELQEADDAIKKSFDAIIDGLSKDGLRRILLEEYQLSLTNAQFLLDAYNQTKVLSEKGISKELMRNYNEEEPHANILAKDLLKLGIDVDRDYVPFQPMANFLNLMQDSIDKSPTGALSAMYCGEFRGVRLVEIMRDVAIRLGKQTGLPADSVVSFFEMHMDGVEQSHRDELGAFLCDVEEIDYKELETLALAQTQADRQLWLQIFDEAASM